jgi:hypothetical protein
MKGGSDAPRIMARPIKRRETRCLAKLLANVEKTPE